MPNDPQAEGAVASLSVAPLRSGALARLAGVSTDTLRHYERIGVLPIPRRAANGYREYPGQALDRVRLVRRALWVGFTLVELASVLKQRDQGRSPCRDVRALAAAKLTRMEQELVDLTARCEALRSTLRGWDRRLASKTPGRQARLLDHVLAVGDGAMKPPRRGPPLAGFASASRGRR